MRRYIYLSILVLISVLLLSGKKNTTTIQLDLPTLMHEVRETPFPLNGATVTQNPPALMWPDQFPHLGPVLDGVEEIEHKPHVTYKIRLSQDPKFKKEVIETTRHWAFFNPFRTLKSGKWYWQYAYINGNKETWSDILHFTISPQASTFNPPSLEFLLQKLPQYHPRVLLDKKDWENFRIRNAKNKEAQWYIKRAQKAIQSPLKHIQEEIDTTKLSSLDNSVQRKSYLIRESRKIVDREEANIEALVRSYLLTQDNIYYKAAISRITEILSWKHSRYFAGDFNSSVLLSICTLGYDSFYDLMSKNEKKILLEGIRENGKQFFEEFVNHLENRIADNHVWQMTLRILTMAAFTTYGDLPEANIWVDYCYNMWVARFPGLNDDGAWHNGDSYFHVNIRTLIEIPAFYSRITGFDFFSDPWYNGSALYTIYHQLPGSMSAGHGNSHENMKKPNGSRVGYADALARECNNSYAADYVKKVLEREPDILKKSFLGKSGDLTWYRLTTHKQLPQNSPGLAELPHTKVFPQTGLVTMHTHPDKTEENAMLSFRSSPYGSTSHALANQNAFNTFYGGQPIFYSSGHRTGFTDDHCMYSYRNTRAHNTILADGMGQKIGTEGYGWIPRFYEGNNISYFIGDASNAYGEVTSPLWLERARLSGTKFSPENGWDKNKVKTYRRHVAKLGDSGLFVIYDELEGTEPITWTFLLHTVTNPMDIKKNISYTLVKGENKTGTSDAYILSSHPIDIKQSDEFFSPAINWLNKTDANGKRIEYKNHWHFSATTPKTKKARFLTIIDTHKKGEKRPTLNCTNNSISIDNWNIKCNLTENDEAYLIISSDICKSGILYNAPKMIIEKHKIKHKVDGSTLIIDQIKNKQIKKVLVDQLPELEI